MTAIGATSSMNMPTRSRRMSRNSLPIVSHTARSIIASNKPQAPWRVAQRVAGEFQERVLKIGSMDVEFDHLVANLSGALDDVGHLVERMQSGRGREPIDNLPRQLADARDPVRPSRWQRFFRHDFNSRFGTRQRN